MSPADGGSTQSTSVPNAPMTAGSSQKLTLHLGVLVQPYAGDTFTNHRNRSNKKNKHWVANTRGNAMTTADVAEILEAKYGVMAAFATVHEQDIAKAIEGSLEGALESLLMGRAVDPWGSGMQQIQEEFRDFISSKEVENVGIPGTPTKAAIRGVNHRLKHPYRSGNPRRPSFRDTGMYMNSFRSWVD